MTKQPKATQEPAITAATEARVEHIADLMRTLQFRRGVTVKQLAKTWDLTEQRVREISAAASARVKAEIADPDAVTTKVSLALEEVIDTALEEMRGAVIVRDGEAEDGGDVLLRYDPNGARKSIIAAAKTWADITGATAAVRLKVTQEPASKLTDDELRKLLAPAVAALSAEGAEPCE